MIAATLHPHAGNAVRPHECGWRGASPCTDVKPRVSTIHEAGLDARGFGSPAGNGYGLPHSLAGLETVPTSAVPTQPAAVLRATRKLTSAATDCSAKLGMGFRVPSGCFQDEYHRF